MQIRDSASVRDAMNAINASSAQIAILTDESGRVVGVATDGDVRRGLLRGVGLEASAREVMNPRPVTAPPGASRETLIQLMRARKIRQILELDAEGRLEAVHSLDQITQAASLENWVVLMVGGLGTRLGEVTRHTPKPLIDVGGRPILETIIQGFVASGFTRFFLSVNYKAEMIKEHFGDGAQWGARIDYLMEPHRTGTAGSLALLPERPKHPFFVMNGDLLTRVDFRSMLHAHLEANAALSMCVREFSQQIQFGVVETSGGRVTAIREKPTYTYLLSAGIYVLSPEALDVAPKEPVFFDMPDLIQRNLEAGRVVNPFLIHEYWRDVGNMESLSQARSEYTGEFGG